MLERGAQGVTPARDAATVILLRESAARESVAREPVRNEDTPAGSAPFEVYLLRRHSKSGFMGGAHVFPGGKVDPEDGRDGAWAASTGLTTESACARLHESLSGELARAFFMAAARETFEEAGVLLGAEWEPSSELRQRANAGERFETLLLEAQRRVELGGLWPYSRWITPEGEGRRYDTRFFVARVPSHQRAAPDLHETTAGTWLSPSAALTANARGDILLPPPTLRTLENLAARDSVEAVLAGASRQAPPLVMPKLELIDGAPMIVLPGDPLHSERERALPGSTRIALRDGRWVSQDADPS